MNPEFKELLRATKQMMGDIFMDKADHKSELNATLGDKLQFSRFTRKSENQKCLTLIVLIGYVFSR